jgi:hypothetical protein
VATVRLTSSRAANEPKVFDILRASMLTGQSPM